jgi:hypothetical protein
MNGTMNERRSGGAFHLRTEFSAAARAAGPRGVAFFDLFVADARGRGYSTLANDVLCAELRCSDDTVTRNVAALACAGLLSVRYARFTGKLRRRVVFIADIIDTADGPHFVESSILADPNTEVIVEAEAKPRTAGGAPRRFKIGDLESVSSMRHQVRPVSQYPAPMRHIERSIPRTGAGFLRAGASDLREIEERGQTVDARASTPPDTIRPIPSGSAVWGGLTSPKDDDAGLSPEIPTNGGISASTPKTVSSETISTAAPVPAVTTAPTLPTGTRHEAAVETPKAKSTWTPKAKADPATIPATGDQAQQWARREVLDVFAREYRRRFDRDAEKPNGTVRGQALTLVLAIVAADPGATVARVADVAAEVIRSTFVDERTASRIRSADVAPWAAILQNGTRGARISRAIGELNRAAAMSRAFVEQQKALAAEPIEDAQSMPIWSERSRAMFRPKPVSMAQFFEGEQ